MASVLEQLDRDAVALMYVAEELSAEDRADIERRISQDSELAQAIERARRDVESFEQALRSEDAQTALPMSADTAVRRVSRAMKQWQVDRLTKQAMQPGARARFRLPVWAYPTGVAVAVIVGALIWARSLPDAGAPRLDPKQIAEMQQKTMDELGNEWQSRWEQDLESYDMLAKQDLPADVEDDFADIFLRSGS